MNSAALGFRLRAGLGHLAVSVLVAAAAMALIFGIWYPEPLAQAQSVSHLVLILIGVDVALGPLITTLVFNPGKQRAVLIRDLQVIVALQLAALIYGLSTIFVARPAYVVFNVDRFDVVPAVEVNKESQQRARKRGAQSMPLWGPRTVAARIPEDATEQQRLLFSSVGGGADLPQLPEWYLPYTDDKQTVLAKMRPLAELRKLNDLSDSAWNQLIDELGGDESALGYLPMRARAKDGVVIVDAKTAEILGIRLLVPKWESDSKPAPAQAPASVSPGIG